MVRKRRVDAALNQSALAEIDSQGQRLVDIEVKKVLKVSAIARAEYEEIKACAYLGFLEAQRRFDPRKGVLFASYARQRVRGAILDGIAHLSPLGRKSVKAITRSLRKQDVQAFEQSVHEQKTGSQKKNLQLGESRVDQKEIHSEGEDSSASNELNHIAAPSFIESYRALYFQAIHFWVESLSFELASDPAEPYQNQIEHNSDSKRLSIAFETLSMEQQQLLIAIYDLRRVGDNATKYAERMKLHRSTVSRRHAAAISHLRTIVESLD